MQRQFERRLRRALTEAEAGVLRGRYEATGADALSEVVMDLDAEALAARLGG